MKKIVCLLILGFFLSSFVVGQDTLRRENGVVFLGIPLVTSPNTLDGWGSADGGAFGEDYIYTYVELNDSYNGVNLEGSRWMSSGELLPEKFPEAMALGLGFLPDTFLWNFHVDTLFVEVKDAETPLTQNYTFIYEVFEGANTGPLDSLHIVEIDGTLEEPSIIQVFPQITTATHSLQSDSRVFELYPNPSGRETFMYSNISISDASRMELSIISLDGRVCFEKQTINIEEGCQRTKLPLPEKSGVYFVRILIDERELYFLKWIVH